MNSSGPKTPEYIISAKISKKQSYYIIILYIILYTKKYAKTSHGIAET